MFRQRLQNWTERTKNRSKSTVKSLLPGFKEISEKKEDERTVLSENRQSGIAYQRSVSQIYHQIYLTNMPGGLSEG